MLRIEKVIKQSPLCFPYLSGLIDQRLLQKAQAQNVGHDWRAERDGFSFTALWRTSSGISVVCQAIILENVGDDYPLKNWRAGGK